MFVRHLAAFLCLSALAGAEVSAASLDGLAVDVTNKSEPVLCAEKDNVTLNLASPTVKAFRIEGAHPAYINTLQRDSFEADWTACDMKGDPSFAPPQAPAAPKRVTIYEEIEMWVTGLTFPTFWRPATATFRVGDRVEKGLHLIQVWMIRPMGGEEVLVFYPQDGYWRLRPMAPAGMAPTAFGSSFLIGPIEEEGRPIVRIKEIVFDPKGRTFTLNFERGGIATIKISKVDQNRHALDVVFDKPIAGRPFAALRSRWAVFGAIAIGLYVGAEVSIGSIMINFLNREEVLNLSLETAGFYLANIYWMGALVGRFVGSYLLTRFPAAVLLGCAAAMAALLCVTVVTADGPIAAYAALMVGLFNSIMFPTIFTITLERAGVAQSSTSGLLCVAIVGGAILPYTVGLIADNLSLSTAFLVPMLAYVAITVFAMLAAKARAGRSRRSARR